MTSFVIINNYSKYHMAGKQQERILCCKIANFLVLRFAALLNPFKTSKEREF